VVTFLTDFGAADYFAAAMKGALLTVCPSARAFDFSHEIPPQDIEAAAFTLFAGYDAWPAATIHVAVVDPGVGSSRRPLLIEAGDYYFVGPDNGLFSYIYERHADDLRVRHITNDQYFRQPVSPSFHGRDVFAPVAGALAGGVAPDEFGPEIADFVRLPPLTPQTNPDGSLASRVIHIDRFGNCVTGITPQDVSPAQLERGFRLRVNGHTVTRLRPHFAAAPDQEPFAIWGSAGFLEISLNGASAAQLLDSQRGEAVNLRLS
jgi:hypothetical protein